MSRSEEVSLCQPLFVPPQQPGGQPAAGISSDDLSGIWMDAVSMYTEFRDDGTFRAADSIGGLETLPMDQGTFQLQGNEFTLTSDEDTVFGRGTVGIYQVRLTETGDLEMVQLEDPCRERVGSLDLRPLIRVQRQKPS